MSVLIKNGRIVTAVDDYRADLFISDETVTLIGRDLVIDAGTVIDATGKLVVPGGIDPHTHLEMPFGGTVTSDTFETGTRAAAFGGTTCVVDFAIQSRGTSTIESARRMACEGRGQDRDRLLVSHDHHRFSRRIAFPRCAGSPTKE